jgi:hypothetical protein
MDHSQYYSLEGWYWIGVSPVFPTGLIVAAGWILLWQADSRAKHFGPQGNVRRVPALLCAETMRRGRIIIRS